MMLNIYSIFHVNLAYSSISESDRKKVIDDCLWPLLYLVIDKKIPLAITAPAYTIEVIAELDPSWIKALTNQIKSNSVEFYGGGYTQLIGPLVPAEINRRNLEIGRSSYAKHLGYIPEIWYINEQAYSASLVEHYKWIGAKAIIMEWNNPRTYHPEWKEDYHYFAQKAVGINGETIPLIWNDSISFQKFQKMAHNEIRFEELREHLLQYLSHGDRNVCLYGNDAEIFDFRPGRFKTEPQLREQKEWKRIKDFFEILQKDSMFKLILPSQVLSTSHGAEAFVPISLQTSIQPIPVKKQPKYNITRWAVTGRDSIFVNSKCFMIEKSLRNLTLNKILTDQELEYHWKELCYLWSSDFRTHITQERWDEFLKRIEKEEKFVKAHDSNSNSIDSITTEQINVNGLDGVFILNTLSPVTNIHWNGEKKFAGCLLEQEDRFFRIRTPTIDITFNCRRGFTIHNLIFPEYLDKSFVGSISHGYYKDVALSYDWYTANSVLQQPGKPQVTDLESATFSVNAESTGDTEWICCSVTVSTELGNIQKSIRIHKQFPQIDFDVLFDWPTIPLGSFKAAFITLIPESFIKDELFYATHNGGNTFEIFSLPFSTVMHDAPSSSVVSASHGLGATKGLVVLGDSSKGIGVYFDNTICAAMPMLTCIETPPSYFARVMLSCGEMDESRKQPAKGPLRLKWSLFGLKRKSINRK